MYGFCNLFRPPVIESSDADSVVAKLLEGSSKESLLRLLDPGTTSLSKLPDATWSLTKTLDNGGKTGDDSGGKTDDYDESAFLDNMIKQLVAANEPKPSGYFSCLRIYNHSFMYS